MVKRGTSQPAAFTHFIAMSDSTPPDRPYDPAAATDDPFQAAKASAMKAAEELRQATAAKAQEWKTAAEARAQQFKDAAGHIRENAEQRADQFREAANDAWSDARVKVDDLRAEAERYTREKPIQAVLTAFGVGLFLGLILRR
jgi:ElaB/YqjD/DUF883 family membrane-anchored ribosome-binding protein